MSKKQTADKKECSNTSPRGYLSWSQLSMYEKDPFIYYQIYIEGLDQIRTKYLELGKRMATTLENGFDVENDPMFELMVVLMPPYIEREYEIKQDFEGIPLFGKLDGFNEATLTVGEYKSGKKWTQSMVDQNGQLTFYALLVWLKYKTLPKRIYLHWARTTEDKWGRLQLTGEVKTFEAKRTMKDIILFSKRIKKAWEGICQIGADNKKQNNG